MKGSPTLPVFIGLTVKEEFLVSYIPSQQILTYEVDPRSGVDVGRLRD
jgi:hypothetical protein